ncbi:uncharacterized protein MONOS_4431 [Monocercomonoides exilis]|uniref:uncharacterized protein n=1 Tax=Monocercomonoides exilis TaxID=2049356 RepID=UPI003559CD97|nr:hypothetical protein MONOS_4431 [Monocercomonoides exilis]
MICYCFYLIAFEFCENEKFDELLSNANQNTLYGLTSSGNAYSLVKFQGDVIKRVFKIPEKYRYCTNTTYCVPNDLSTGSWSKGGFKLSDFTANCSWQKAMSEVATAYLFEVWYRLIPNTKKMNDDDQVSAAYLSGCDVASGLDPINLNNTISAQNCKTQTHIITSICSAFDFTPPLMDCVKFTNTESQTCPELCNNNNLNTVPQPFHPLYHWYIQGLLLSKFHEEGLREFIIERGPFVLEGRIVSYDHIENPGQNFPNGVYMPQSAYTQVCNNEDEEEASNDGERVFLTVIGFAEKTIPASSSPTGQDETCLCWLIRSPLSTVDYGAEHVGYFYTCIYTPQPLVNGVTTTNSQTSSSRRISQSNAGLYSIFPYTEYIGYSLYPEEDPFADPEQMQSNTTSQYSVTSKIVSTATYRESSYVTIPSVTATCEDPSFTILPFEELKSLRQSNTNYAQKAPPNRKFGSIYAEFDALAWTLHLLDRSADDAISAAATMSCLPIAGDKVGNYFDSILDDVEGRYSMFLPMTIGTSGFIDEDCIPQQTTLSATCPTSCVATALSANHGNLSLDSLINSTDTNKATAEAKNFKLKGQGIYSFTTKNATAHMLKHFLLFYGPAQVTFKFPTSAWNSFSNSLVHEGDIYKGGAQPRSHFDLNTQKNKSEEKNYSESDEASVEEIQTMSNTSISPRVNEEEMTDVPCVIYGWDISSTENEFWRVKLPFPVGYGEGTMWISIEISPRLGTDKIEKAFLFVKKVSVGPSEKRRDWEAGFIAKAPSAKFIISCLFTLISTMFLLASTVQIR